MSYYTRYHDRLVFGNSISEILKQLPTRPQFNHRYLSDYFLNGHFASEQNLFETLFEGVYRVPIGYQLKKTDQGVSVDRAWNLEDLVEFVHIDSFKETIEQFRALLLETMTEHLQGYDQIAVELSGGLDSSSVAALVRQCRPNDPLLALTHDVPPQMPSWFETLSKADQAYCQANAYDERAWSRRVSTALNLKQKLIQQCDRFHEVLEKHTEILGDFSEVLFPILNYQSYELCQSLGIKTLLSGFGGDELLTQQHLGLYWQEQRNQGIYWRVLYEKAKHKKAEDWLRFLKMRPSKLSLGRIPDSHKTYLRVRAPEMERTMLPKNKTIHMCEQNYIQGSMSLHWQRRIETSRILAKAYGIDYQFPLTHPRLMQFFYHLPSVYKYYQGKTRAFMRHCMSTFLPKEVVWRNDKAGGTAPAAWFDFLTVFPELFLSRITPDYSGVLVDYVDIPTLIKRVEAGPVVDSNLVRLMVAILMFVHLETSHNTTSLCSIS